MRHLILLLSCLFPLVVFSQHFKPVQTNPFSINTSPYAYNDMQFADLTNDGAFDIIFNDADLEDGPFIMVNKGVLGSPDFTGVPYLDFVDLDENGYGMGSFTSATSRFYDIDQDSLLDHFYNYSSDDPSLPALYAFELNIAPLTTTPDDIFTFFDETEATEIGLPLLPLNSIETYCFGDLDNDGDDDILATRYDETTNQHIFVFYQSLYSMGDKVFNNTALEAPFGLSENNNGDQTFGFPGLIDMDSDGDLDLLVSVISGDWAYYENSGSPEQAAFEPPVTNPFGLTPLPMFGITHILDVNGDGRNDVICGAGDSVYYFENDSPLPNDNQPFIQNNISLNPNPANGFSFLSSKGFYFDEITLMDINGVNIQHINTGKTDNYMLGTEGLSPGIFILKLKLTDGQTIVKKLIKK